MTYRSGGELFVRDLALGLNRLGHKIFLYSPVMGDMVDELLDQSITCLTMLDRIDIEPDVIIGNSHFETVLCLSYFPDVPAISICHDAVASHGCPPIFSRIRSYVAVDALCEERLLVKHGISPSKVTIIHNRVDLERFRPRPQLPKRLRIAAIFSNYATSGNETELVGKACAEYGIELHILGKQSNNQVKFPEDILQKYDLVFAKARCAMEAMVVGCAVILLNEGFGMAGLVTTNNVAHWQRWNFGRKLLLQNQIQLDLIRKEIQKYNANDATQVSSFMRNNCSLTTTINAFEELAVNALIIEKSYKNISTEIEKDEFLQFEYDYLSHSTRLFQSSAQLKVQVGLLHHQLRNPAISGTLHQEQLNSIYTSYSWRITKPLRFILKKIRGLKIRGSNRGN